MEDQINFEWIETVRGLNEVMGGGSEAVAKRGLANVVVSARTKRHVNRRSIQERKLVQPSSIIFN